VSQAGIVVPVWNDEAGLRYLLPQLAPLVDEVAVVVVCNGCTDRSAALARATPGIVVLELAEANKAAALNAGDAAISEPGPRLYLDADLRIETDSLRALLSACATEGAVLAGPRCRYELMGRPWLVRAYYYGEGHAAAPVAWHRAHLAGRGCYALSAAGRARFGPFPPVRNDDEFVDACFANAERLEVEAAEAQVVVARSTSELVRSLVRVQLGHDELAERKPPAPALTARPLPFGVRLAAYLRRLWGSPAVTEFELWATPSRLFGYELIRLVVAIEVRRARRRGSAPWR